jgi:hypothetical protein
MVARAPAAAQRVDGFVGAAAAVAETGLEELELLAKPAGADTEK